MKFESDKSKLVQFLWNPRHNMPLYITMTSKTYQSSFILINPIIKDPRQNVSI